MKIRGLIKRVCLVAGIILLVGAILSLAFWRWNIESSIKKAEGYVRTLTALIPQPQDAVLEERRDNTMSVLSVDNTDFVGIIELPEYELVLPVGAEWGSSSTHPCLFSGSIYNGTIQIGATTQKGQLDFYRELSLGDAVTYTDMEGNRYTFEIIDIEYEKQINESTLRREDTALTLFIKNIYSFEYVVVFCDVQK